MMSAAERRITREDILSLEAYEAVRAEKRRALIPQKKYRRVEVGPHATFYFENYDTMWMQIHEMLRIEKGGEAQIADELSAYNPLIPQGQELVATVMFEIDDAVRRRAVLGQLGGVEETIFLQIGEDKIYARAEEDVDRTTAAGKSSSVHFIRFALTDAQIAAFGEEKTQVILGFEHERYAHMTLLTAPVRAALAKDFA